MLVLVVLVVGTRNAKAGRLRLGLACLWRVGWELAGRGRHYEREAEAL
jgi:hypothetical protein